MIKDEIKKIIKKAVQEEFKKIKISGIKIEKPENKEFGDYSSNIALQICRSGLTRIATPAPEQSSVRGTARKNAEKLSSIKVAESLVAKIKSCKESNNLFERIEVAGPGFINFYLSKEYLQKQVREILKKGEKFGNLGVGKSKKIQVEFISANPTGPLTVGNARGGPFGDVLANMLKKAGFKVEKAYYINDYGMQIMALGHSVLKDEEAKYKGEYIDYLHKKIKPPLPKNRCGGKEKDLYPVGSQRLSYGAYKTGQKAAKIIVDEMLKKTTKKMGIEYDEWFSESSLYNSGAVDRVLDFLKKKGLIYKKEGAEFFKSSKFGDKRDRVVVKKDGWRTYLAGDIAYHKHKFEKKKFDKVMNIWGADHAGDVPGLQAGVTALGHKGKLDIILSQFVTLLEKTEKIKMSKRRGIYVTMDELLDEVGPDVTRFFFLQKSADTHLNFDISLAKEQSKKNPVYYIQYGHARICSILKKAQMSKSKCQIKSKAQNPKLLTDPLELVLIRQLIRLPEIVEDIAKDYQVQRLPSYALELVTTFHKFYEECRVISDDKKITQARLILIRATKIVLKNILDLMGISAPERM